MAKRTVVATVANVSFNLVTMFVELLLTIIVWIATFCCYSVALVAPRTALSWVSSAQDLEKRFALLSKLLPWRSKRVFLLAWDKATRAEKIKLFREGEAIKFTPDMVDELWAELSAEQRLDALKHGHKCKPEMLRVLVEKQEFKAMKWIIGYGIGVSDRILSFIKLANKTNKPEVKSWLLKEMEHNIKTQGWNHDEIENGYRSGDREVISVMEEAVKIHSQICLVREGWENASFWTNYIETGGELSAEAQSHMSLEEYEVFHTQGRHLEEAAVKRILHAGHLEEEYQLKALKVIEYEIAPFAGKGYSNEVMSLVMSDHLYNMAYTAAVYK